MYQSFPSTLSAQSVFATSTKPRVPVDIGHAAQTPIAELARLLQIDADALGAFAADTFTTRRVKPGDARAITRGAP